MRARDFQEKKKRLQSLRQKAAERNPDEFRYGMLSSQSKQGRKIAERGNPILSHEVVKLLKTQDAGYLRTMLQKTRRAVEKLEQEFVLREQQGPRVLGGLESGEDGQYTVFVDNREEQKQYLPGRNVSLGVYERVSTKRKSPQRSAEDSEEETPEANSNPTQRNPKSRRAVEREIETLKQDKLLRKRHKKEQNARQAKLIALRAREKDLLLAENELELQRAKMNNNVGGITKAGVKWRPRERKK